MVLGEQLLFNYGVLGIWTFFNILTIKYYREKEEKRENKLIEVITENTKIISIFNEKLNKLK